MGRRSRRRDASPHTPPEPAPRRKSSEQRNAEVRAKLQPLGPSERPPALVVAVVLAAAIALANIGFLVAGWEVRGEQPSPFGVILFSALMLACAYYMWAKRYWAVLGFQALLALSCIFAFISLLVASNVQAALLSVAIIALGGLLFWKLVRVLARLQMPDRGDSVRRHG